jgi:hypothetical protein
MEYFERTLLIGVVFDLSDSNSDGTRNLDVVKDILLKDILDVKVNSKIYIYHPDWQTIPRDQGESTYYVVSYKEPLNFYIDSAFKTAVSVVGEYVEDCDKYVFLITDRFQALKNYHYRKGFLSNNIRNYNTKICVFGVGNNYDDLTLKSISEEYESYFSHSPEVNLLSDKIKEVFRNN